MKISKTKIFTILGLLLVLILTACSHQDVDRTNDKLEIKTNLKNMDIVFYKNRSSNYAIQFLAVSNKRLDEKDISFQSDDDTPIKFFMEKTTDMELDYYDYLVTKKLDWKEIAKSMLSNNPQEQAETGEKLNSYQEDYMNSDLGMKDYYTYIFTLNFDVLPETYNETSLIKTIIMKVKDQKFNLSVGNIELQKQGAQNNIDSIDQINAIGRVGKKVIPDVRKKYNEDISDWQFDVINDVKLQSIESLQKDIVIDKVTIRIKKQDGSELEKVFMKDTIELELKKGDKFTLNPVFEAKKTDQIIYHQTYNYKMHLLQNGIEKSAIVESGILSTTDTAYKILHEKDLFKEYQSYYQDFAQLVDKE